MINDNRTKVAFVLPALTAGGAERVLITLMNALDRDIFAPVFITISDKGEIGDLVDENIEFIRLGGSRVSRSLPRLLITLKKIRPDAVVSTMAHMNLCLLTLKLFFPKVKFIVREAITPSFIFSTRPDIEWLVKWGYKTLYPLAHAVISPAEAIIREFNSIPGMNTDNVVLVRNPVNTAKIRFGNKGYASFDAIDRSTETVLFVAAGRLHYQKGFDRLIEKLPEFNSPYKWKLTILGEGDERELLEALIRKNNLEDRVSLPGLLANPWPEYAKADCFLLPSRCEGLPNVVLESLECGTPVIASGEAGGIREISALSAQGAVTVVNDMDEFLAEMEKISPCGHSSYRESLLPDDFSLAKVVSKFSELLTS